MLSNSTAHLSGSNEIREFEAMAKDEEVQPAPLFPAQEAVGMQRFGKITLNDSVNTFSL
jgi:hypothetical protein